MEEEGDGGSGGGTPGAAVGDFGAGDLVEGEQEDDVGGKAETVEAVVDGEGGEGPEGEEGGEGGKDPIGLDAKLGTEVEVGGEDGGEGGSGEGSEDAGEASG